MPFSDLCFINSSNKKLYIHMFFPAFSVSYTVLQVYFPRQLLYCHFNSFPSYLILNGRGDHGTSLREKCCKVFYLFPFVFLCSHPFYPHGLKILRETLVSSRFYPGRSLHTFQQSYIKYLVCARD